MARPKSRKSTLKKIIRWLVAGLVLSPILWFFYIEAGRVLGYLAIRQIAELTNTNIRTGSIEFQTDGSVFIEQLIISPKNQKGRDTILTAKTVFARFNPASLLLLQPRLKVINVDNFVFNAQYDLDTGWLNLSGIKLTPPKGNVGKMPRVSLTNGTLQYSKISNGQSQVAVSVPLDADFGLDKDSEDGYKFEITTATMSSGFAKSRLEGSWKPGIVTLAGGISSVDVPELRRAWFIDVLAAEFKYDRNNDFLLKLSIPDLQSRRNDALDNLASVGPVFLGKSGLFTALQGFFDMYQPKGMVDAELEMSGNLSRLRESTMAGNANCKDGAFCYNNFPYAIENLTGRIDFTKNSVTLNNLSGKHDETRLFINGSLSDFGPDLKYDIRITSDKMPLDNDLYNALKPRQKEFWSAFSPTGFAVIYFELIRQAQTDKEMNLVVELHDTEAVYRNFPYQLKNLTGRLLFNRNKVIFSDVTSQASQHKIALNGEIETRGDDKPAMYDFLINVNNVPLDATLEAALTEKQKNLYEQFCPAGLADGLIKVSTQDSGHPSVTAGLSFRNTSLKSEQFPLPVSDITAKAIFTPDLINVKEFAGRYGNDLISLTCQIHLDTE